MLRNGRWKILSFFAFPGFQVVFSFFRFAGINYCFRYNIPRIIVSSDRYHRLNILFCEVRQLSLSLAIINTNITITVLKFPSHHQDLNLTVIVIMEGGYKPWKVQNIIDNSPDLDSYGRPLPPPPPGYYWERRENLSWELMRYGKMSALTCAIY